MRLIGKLTVWYIIITAIVLTIGGMIVFREIMHNVDREAYIKLNSWVRSTAEQLKQGVSVEELSINPSVTVIELDYDEPVIEHYQNDSTGIFPPRKRGDDRRLIIGKSFKINGNHYYITAQNFIAEPDEIEEGIQSSMMIIFIILIVFVGIVSLIVSRIILRPFKNALLAMDEFNLKQQQPILLSDTHTKEFKSLNRFLEKMTYKAINDYKTLKEFSENASHEIQTPLAIIRGKLELLMDSQIDQDQAESINSIQNAVNKLSSIHHSLALITKLENEEYTLETINFSNQVKNAVAYIKELVEMNNIALETDIEDQVMLHFNSYLADVVLNNLLSNAVKHNLADGYIKVDLRNAALIIENVGHPLEVAPEQLFKRFKKSNQSGSSTGLGLSIVKQICDLSNFQISYTNEGNIHRVTIEF